jgi:hypothetical protein
MIGESACCDERTCSIVLMMEAQKCALVFAASAKAVAVFSGASADATSRARSKAGWVVEWFKAPVLKTGEGKPSVSSNLTPSATAPKVGEQHAQRHMSLRRSELDA